MLTQAEGQRKIIVNEVRADTITHVNEAKAEAQKLVIEAERKAKIMGIVRKCLNACCYYTNAFTDLYSLRPLLAGI